MGYGWRLSALLALGGMQGAIGWWMVASGLSVRTDVSHIRLMVHLLTAPHYLGRDRLDRARSPDTGAQPRSTAPARVQPVAGLALLLLFAQLGFGALTAGLNAGYAYASWPLMGDALFPAGALPSGAGSGELVNNPAVVQFVHRWLAFVAATGLLTLAWRAGRAGSQAGLAVAVLVVLQIGLGIATLLSGVRIEIAVWHQLNAALLLIVAVGAAHAIGKPRQVT